MSMCRRSKRQFTYVSLTESSTMRLKGDVADDSANALRELVEKQNEPIRVSRIAFCDGKRVREHQFVEPKMIKAFIASE